MPPLPMHPAYRHGDMTPWGGTQLRDVYHRAIPDERTGEALEISAIPNLESTTSTGETLPQLLAREGRRLAGDCAGQPFPLLLAHRPEWFPLYAEGGAALVFSGHAHGGQG